MADFLTQISETDLLHDVIIRVKRPGEADSTFAAHLFVLVSRSKHLGRLVSAWCDQQVKVQDTEQWPDILVENVYPEVMKDCLEFLYSGQYANPTADGSSELQDLGPPIVYLYGSNRPEVTEKEKSKYRKISSRRSLLNRLLSKLAAGISKQSSRSALDDEVKSSKQQHSTLSPSSYSRLYDCVIECNNAETFQAHQCILAARIPYFAGMLFSPWIEREGKRTRLKVCYQC